MHKQAKSPILFKSNDIVRSKNVKIQDSLSKKPLEQSELLPSKPKKVQKCSFSNVRKLSLSPINSEPSIIDSTIEADSITVVTKYLDIQHNQPNIKTSTQANLYQESFYESIFSSKNDDSFHLSSNFQDLKYVGDGLISSRGLLENDKISNEPDSNKIKNDLKSCFQSTQSSSQNTIEDLQNVDCQAQKTEPKEEGKNKIIYDTNRDIKINLKCNLDSDKIVEIVNNNYEMGCMIKDLREFLEEIQKESKIKDDKIEQEQNNTIQLKRNICMLREEITKLRSMLEFRDLIIEDLEKDSQALKNKNDWLHGEIKRNNQSFLKERLSKKRRLD